MGGSSSKTHPLSEQERIGQPMMSYGRDRDLDAPPPYGHEYDPRAEHDSGWYPGKQYGNSYRDNPNSPIAKRSCTDVLCFFLFLAFLGSWAAIAFFGIRGGDISKVLNPTDTDGNVCGNGTFVDRKFLIMFDLTQCLNPAVLVTGCQTTQVCVKKCPTEAYSPYGDLKLGKPEFLIKEKMRPYCKLVSDAMYQQMSVQKLIDQEICPPWYLPSTAVLGWCIPISISINSNDGNDVVVRGQDTPNNKPVDKNEINSALYRLGGFLQVRDFAERIFNDLVQTYWMIGIALIGACILSFIWIVLMRFLAGFMIWSSILIVFLGLGGLLSYSGYRLYFAYLDTDKEAQQNIFQLNWTPDILHDFIKQRDTWIAFTSVLGILFFVFVCLFIFLRQRIIIAIGLIEEGSKAVGTMFSSLFFPIIPWLFQVVVIGWFLLVSLYLSSWGSQEYRVVIKNATFENDSNPCAQYDACKRSVDGSQDLQVYHTNDTCNLATFSNCSQVCSQATCQFVKYTRNKDYEWMQFVNVFGLYWGVFFFSAFGELVLAGVFARWYWVLDKKKNLPTCALGTSMWNAAVFHLGTVAFGSLIIAIIRMIRTILEYIEKKIKRYNNDLTKCILCCCKCCLYCLEKFMRFINRNAYIVCAMKSTNFCKSAQEAFNLIMRNVVRAYVLDSVVDFCLLLGKLVIVLITGATSFMAFGGYIPDIQDDIPTLNYSWTPVVFIAVGSYFIASAFFSVYAMAVDTLFLCLLEDLERNDGTPERPHYMSKSLKQIMGKMEKSVAQSRTPHY